MSFSFTKGILKICVAQICQNIGWHAVQTSPMDILIDVLHRYLLEISKAVHRYSNQYGRTEPNLDDVALTFKDFGIILQEIEEYVNNVEPVPFVHKIPTFPVAHPSQLQHPNPASREILHRPEHIPEYLPLMHPELEEEEGLLSPVFESGSKKGVMDTSGTGDGDSPSPLSSPKHGTKRPNEWSNDIPTTKKPRHYAEEEGRPMREVTSVFMTPTGFISPAREGKAAEPTLPHTIDSPPSTPEPPTPTNDATVSKKESKSKDAKKDKSSKSKKEKDGSKKDVKKVKSSKKENKENTALASEKSTPSFSGKKEHVSSHKSSGKSEKSSKSNESSHQKAKSDKSKSKEGKEEHRKNKEHLKLGKCKSKLKHGSSSFSKSLKSSKFSKSPQKYVAKSPKKASKSPKSEKKNTVTNAVPPSPVAKAEVCESNFVKPEIKEDNKPYLDMEEVAVKNEELSREESPEPRLVIDDSIETQMRQERESRLAGLDECIDAVIQRGQEESELETEKSHKAVDETIDEVVKGPVMRRLEPKDIYDFTDSSELSSLSSLEPDDSPFEITPIKKEKSRTPDSEKGSDSLKKGRVKEKQRKKTRDTKTKSPGAFTSSKNQKSPNVIVKREERSPSPIKLKDEIFSSDDESVLSRSPSPANIFDLPPLPSHQKHLPPAPSLSELPPPSPFASSTVPSVGFSTSPFAPIRPMPCHIQSNPHFPTPPLFVTSKSDQASMFQRPPSPQPLNLAKSSSTVASKDYSDSKAPEPFNLSSSKPEDAVDARKLKSEGPAEKGKGKNQRKEKKEKEKEKEKPEKKEKVKKRGREKKEKEKPRAKEKLESAKEREKPKEKPKPKIEKAAKEEKKGKAKPEREKKKEKEEKVADDSAVPKFTVKITAGNSGSGKFFIKPPSSKHLSSPPPDTQAEERVPSPPARVASPSPPGADAPGLPPAPAASPPPSPVRPPTPPPAPPAPAPAVSESPDPFPIPATQQAGTKATHSRGRGRGRKAAAQPAVQPPARTVITETLGTIVDESGNKIWICPACTRPDDGSPMIGCDECDDWYHWVCVGIVVPPKEEENWFCTRCISKRQSVPAKRRRKKHKKDK